MKKQLCKLTTHPEQRNTCQSLNCMPSPLLAFFFASFFFFSCGAFFLVLLLVRGFSLEISAVKASFNICCSSSPKSNSGLETALVCFFCFGVAAATDSVLFFCFGVAAATDWVLFFCSGVAAAPDSEESHSFLLFFFFLFGGDDVADPLVSSGGTNKPLPEELLLLA